MPPSGIGERGIITLRMSNIVKIFSIKGAIYQGKCLYMFCNESNLPRNVRAAKIPSRVVPSTFHSRQIRDKRYYRPRSTHPFDPHPPLQEGVDNGGPHMKTPRTAPRSHPPRDQPDGLVGRGCPRPYARRWKVEEFYRDAKQHLGLGRCQMRSPEGTRRHWYLVLLMYCLAQTVGCPARVEGGLW